jgi:hypothetical protein
VVDAPPTWVYLTQVQRRLLPHLTTDDPQRILNALIELDILFKSVDRLDEPLCGLVTVKHAHVTEVFVTPFTL